MTNANLYALLQSRFPGDESAVFLESPDGSALSYRDADTLSARMAAALKGLGVAPGDRVVVQVEKSPEAVALYLACLRIAAIYIPLNTAYTAAEVGYFLADAEPRVLVCETKNDAALRAVSKSCAEGYDGAHVVCLDSNGGGSFMETVVGYEPDNTIATCAADDIAAILYTSGTTGRSKGAMLSHENLASNALTLHELWCFEAGDVLLHALPIYHVHGLFVALHCAMLNGSKVWFLPKFDVAAVLGLLPRSTVMMGVPTFYVRLLGDERFTPDVCATMRLFIAGSAPLLAETFAAFEARTGHRILERYGMTEAGMITSNPYKGDRLAGTVGFALPGVEARVCDGEGREVARGETGVLEIRGANVFGGYWRNPEKTAAEFRPDGFFITGDMAEMDETGRIAIVGRAKDLVISGGFNVYPKEIEVEIDQIAGVLESAVIGVPHPDFGEAVTAIVVATVVVNDAALTPEDITTYLAGRLAKFKQPKCVFFVDSLPRNAMGKVQKKELRERYADTYL